MLHRYFWPLIAIGLFGSLQIPQGRAERADQASPFSKFVDDYYEAFFPWSPSGGTAIGLHQYDNKLEDWSARAFPKRVETIKGFQKRLEKLRQGKLTADEEIDAEILDGQMRAELLDLETLANWRRNPIGYIMVGAGSVDGLMKRDFAPAAQR